jgi:hypothetical protein
MRVLLVIALSSIIVFSVSSTAQDKHLGRQSVEVIATNQEGLSDGKEDVAQKDEPVKLLTEEFTRNNSHLLNKAFWSENKYKPTKKAVLGVNFHNNYESLSKGRDRLTFNRVNKTITLTDEKSSVNYILSSEDFVIFKDKPVKSFLYESDKEMVILDIITIENLSLYFANTFFQKFNNLVLGDLILSKSSKLDNKEEEDQEFPQEPDIEIKGVILPFAEIDYCVQYKDQSIFLRFIVGSKNKALESFSLMLSGKC